MQKRLCRAVPLFVLNREMAMIDAPLRFAVVVRVVRVSRLNRRFNQRGMNRMWLKLGKDAQFTACAVIGVCPLIKIL